MKKIIIFLLLLSFQLNVYANENNQDSAPIDKYTIIKTTHDYTPIREGADVNSKRFSHLKKGTTVFSDSNNKNFYRVDLGLDKYYWIEKKYADIDSTTNEKELTSIDKITLSEDNKYYYIKIEAPYLPPYNEIETSESSLNFILYDTVVDKDKLTIDGENSANIKISKDKYENLQITYMSNTPLSGHEVVKTDFGLILKIKKPFDISKHKPLKGIIVAIDPGHGGADTGACSNGLREKDINLQISNKLKNELKKEGALVYMTRENDTNPDLYERIDFAKEKNADFLISIHQNSLPNPKMVNEKHGVGVYYYNKETYKLSKEIQKELINDTKFKDDGVNIGSFALTRSANPLCILIECGYIIYPDEAKKISDDKFQEVIAKSISGGLKNYLKNNF